MKIFISVLYIILTANSSAQHGQHSSLIPRTTFITGEQRFNFKLSTSGKILFFQTTSDKILHYCFTNSPHVIHNITLPFTSFNWEVADNDLLVASQDSVPKLLRVSITGEQKQISIPFEITKLKIITGEINYFFALDITADSALSGIYRFSAHTNSLNKIAEPQPGKTILFDKEMNMVAANMLSAKEINDVLLFDKHNNRWDTLVKGTTVEDMFLGGFTKVISVSADGKTIYYTTNNYSDKTKVYAYHVQTKKTETLAQSSTVDLLPFGFSTDTNGKVTSVVGVSAKILRQITDPSVSKDFSFLQKKIHGDLSYLAKNKDDSKWLLRDLNGGPTKYYLYYRKKMKLQYLLTDYPALENYSLSKRYAASVTTRDGIKLPVHIYLPVTMDKHHNSIPDKPSPTILYVHGGPWLGVTFWNQYFYWRNFQLLANRGYVVIVCEFRGTTGLGKKFVAMSYKKWGSNMTNDIIDIAHWAVQQKIAKQDKVGIWGWSYGGYAAMAGLAFSPQTYACGISMYGIADLEKFEQTGFASSDYWKVRLGDPVKDQQMLHDFSPINSAGKIKAPLLLTTGSIDIRVAQSQADSMAVALKKLDKRVVYFYYPDEGHDYVKNESWLSFWAVAEKFLSNYLGGQYQPAGSDITNSSLVKVYGKELNVY